MAETVKLKMFEHGEIGRANEKEAVPLNGPLLSSSPHKRPSLRIFRTLPAHEHRLPTVILVTLGLHGLPAAYCAAGWLEPLSDCIEHGGSPLHIIR